MVIMEVSFKDLIATCCMKQYSMLPKTGKPIEGEWTVLSCLVKYHSSNSEIEVISLGTGSKCIGASKMSSSGDIINDSHAEVFARRGFLIYLYDNMEKALLKQPSIFLFSDGKFKLKESVEFAFYSSQLPCGDAAIVPKVDKDLVGDVLKPNTFKRTAVTELCGINPKLCKLESEVNDIHRTGAKCLQGTMQDSRQPGLSYHILGQVRTKPGRGDRTLSVSCSDKLARWIHVGIQGALIDMLVEKPILISRFVFGGGVPYYEESLRRALLERNINDVILVKRPSIHQSTVCFQHCKSESSLKPTAGSILWVNGISEVAVLGRKLGATKKTKNSLSSQLSISKYSLYKRFLGLVKSNDRMKDYFDVDIPYNEMKRKSVRYNENWTRVKEQFFRNWTDKGDIWNFTVDMAAK